MQIHMLSFAELLAHVFLYGDSLCVKTLIEYLKLQRQWRSWTPQISHFFIAC